MRFLLVFPPFQQLWTETNYKPSGYAESPYLRAKEEWDNRIGSTVVQAKNWRLACFGALSLSLLLSAGLIFQATQAKVIPVIVGIDKARGEPVVIGRAGERPYEPQLQEVKFFLSHFISLVRTVPKDPVLVKQNWRKAYAFLRQDAANLLNDITNKDEDSPLKRIGDQTQSIQVLSIVQVPGGDSFQARWEETVYASNGNVEKHYIMNGVFTVTLDPPKDELSLSQNPLGLFIQSFQWNREL